MLSLSIKQKIKYIILFLIMCLVFSIPFGYEYGRKIIVVIFVLWLFVVTKQDLLNILKHKVIMIFFLLVSIYIISLLWSSHTSLGIRDIERVLIFLVMPIIIYSSILSKKDIQYVVSAFIFGMFINEIISYLIYFNLYQTVYSKLHHYPVGFINHIMYSVLVSFSAILILFQAKYMKNKYLKILYIIFFITMTTNLVISSGRTGYVVYFGSLFILLFTYHKVTFRNFLELLIFPSIIFITAYKMDAGVQARMQASMTAIEKIQENKNYDTSFGARLSFYPISYDILIQSENGFIKGVGIGDVKEEMSKSIDRTHIVKHKHWHLHNSYLMALVNAGIFALIFLLSIFYYLWKINIKDKEMLFIKQLIIINIAIASLSDVVLNIREGMFFFSFFIAIILIQEKYEQKELNS